MRGWGTKGLLIGAVAAAVIGVGAMALAAGRSADSGAATGAAAVMKNAFAAADGQADGERGWGGRGCGVANGPMAELMSDEDFRDDLYSLREEHLNDMKAFWDEHGDDPASDAAREAMQKLRDEHRSDMQTLFEKYGVDWDATRAGGAGRGCGGFMGGGAGCGGAGFGGGRGMMSPGGAPDATSGGGASGSSYSL